MSPEGIAARTTSRWFDVFAFGAVAVAVILATVSCSTIPTGFTGVPKSGPSLSVSNDTDLTVEIAVNGELVDAVEPHSGVGPIPIGALPPLPWHVEARTESGRILVDMSVREEDLVGREVAEGGTEHAIPMGRVDLACGRLTLWAGDRAPSGPPWVEGQGGQCTP